MKTTKFTLQSGGDRPSKPFLSLIYLKSVAPLVFAKLLKRRRRRGLWRPAGMYPRTPLYRSLRRKMAMRPVGKGKKTNASTSFLSFRSIRRRMKTNGIGSTRPRTAAHLVQIRRTSPLYFYRRKPLLSRLLAHVKAKRKSKQRPRLLLHSRAWRLACRRRSRRLARRRIIFFRKLKKRKPGARPRKLSWTTVVARGFLRAFAQRFRIPLGAVVSRFLPKVRAARRSLIRRVRYLRLSRKILRNRAYSSRFMFRKFYNQRLPVLRITKSLHNLFFNLLDSKGVLLYTSSLYALAPKTEKNKQSPESLAAVAATIGAKYKAAGAKSILVQLYSRANSRILGFLRSLARQGLNFYHIHDLAHAPHNGLRPKKSRNQRR